MKKSFLMRVNVLLGLLSFALVGCHCGKKAAETSAPERPEPRKYGPPAEMRVDLPDEPVPVQDSVPKRPEPEPCKYGVPGF
ncbi:MAG: hypothetical protein II551_02795 [Paludibacteraceae bacterium]|nr:hypothetical protein [Paludibacteraceae bacterium]